jgi:UDP-N-acetylmuramoylalanine--D-glutamate ligase
MARWCSQYGVNVFVADTRAYPPQLPQLKKEVPTAYFFTLSLGALTTDVLLEKQITVVLKSPGLYPDQVDHLWNTPQKSGIFCGGELDCFAYTLQRLKENKAYTPKIMAITGTNGKTTVASLCQHLLQSQYKNVVLAGNSDLSLLEALALHQQQLPDYWVLELSSFQLHSLNPSTGFHPQVATILNITEDHLDWHYSMESYHQAKYKIFGRDTLQVLNEDENTVKPVRGGDQCIPFSLNHHHDGTRFGLGINKSTAEISYTPLKARGEDILTESLLSLHELKILGDHNIANALAALALCLGVGIHFQKDPVHLALSSYKGEFHRLQRVANIKGIEYIDDSKGTNVGATVVALSSMGSILAKRQAGPRAKIILILGGEAKGQNFIPLKKPMTQYTRSVILIGRDASLIQYILKDTGIPVQQVCDMKEAVFQASRLAQIGDVVLLSPACASFDMFNGYRHRGRVFQEAVYALQEQP